MAYAQTATSPEQFFFEAGYEKGFKEGYEKGYKEGYRQAVKDFKTVLRAYKDDVKALEFGKYLVRNQYVTYPRVYRVERNGKIELIVEGCRIEKMRSLEDVIRNPWEVPELSCERVEEVQNATERLITVPQTVGGEFSYQKTTVLIIPLKVKDTSLLNRLGIPYSVNPQTGEVKAIFFDRREAENFCSKYPVCY